MTLCFEIIFLDVTFPGNHCFVLLKLGVCAYNRVGLFFWWRIWFGRLNYVFFIFQEFDGNKVFGVDWGEELKTLVCYHVLETHFNSLNFIASMSWLLPRKLGYSWLEYVTLKNIMHNYWFVSVTYVLQKSWSFCYLQVN